MRDATDHDATAATTHVVVAWTRSVDVDLRRVALALAPDAAPVATLALLADGRDATCHDLVMCDGVDLDAGRLRLLDDDLRVDWLRAAGIDGQSARVEAHGLLADELQDRAVDHVAHCHEIVVHLTGAGRRDEAVGLLASCADEEVAVGHRVLAVHLLDDAVTLLDVSVASGADSTRMLDLLELAGRLAIEAGLADADERWRALAARHEAAGNDLRASRAWYQAGASTSRAGNEDLLRAARDADLGDPWALRARAALAIQDERFDDVLQLDREVRRHALRSGDRALEALAMHGMACAHAGLGRLDQAVVAQRRATALAAAAGERRVEALSRHNLLWTLIEQLDTAAALDEARQLGAVVREYGLDAWQDRQRCALACMLLASGDVVAARDAIVGVGARASGQLEIDAWERRLRAYILAYSGDGHAALQLLAAFDDGPEWDSLAAEVASVRCAALAIEGEVAAAIEVADVHHLVGTGDLIDDAELSTLLVRLAVLAGDHALATRACRTFLERLTIGSTPLLDLACAELAAVAAALDGGDVDALADVRMAWQAGGRLLDAARVRACIGALRGLTANTRAAARDLDLARRELEACGATTDLDLVRAVERRIALVCDTLTIGATTLGARLDSGALEDLERRAVVRTIAAGTILHAPGDEVMAISIVLAGQVRSYSEVAGGRRVAHALLGPGDVVGLQALSGMGTASTFAEVDQPSTIAVLPRGAAEDLAARYPSFSRALLELAGARVERSEERAGDVVLLAADARIIRVLVELAITHGVEQADGTIELDGRLTQGDLAELAGARREAVSGTLSRLKRDGIVGGTRRQIVILDAGALRACVASAD